MSSGDTPLRAVHIEDVIRGPEHFRSPIPADKWAACYTLEGELVNEVEAAVGGKE